MAKTALCALVRGLEALRPRVEAYSGPLIIDSCCGTGDSTRNLAGRFPEALVVGVDKSAHRLARHQPGDRQNYALVRADVNDFWRLANRQKSFTSARTNA